VEIITNARVGVCLFDKLVALVVLVVGLHALTLRMQPLCPVAGKVILVRIFVPERTGIFRVVALFACQPVEIVIRPLEGGLVHIAVIRLFADA